MKKRSKREELLKFLAYKVFGEDIDPYSKEGLNFFKEMKVEDFKKLQEFVVKNQIRSASPFFNLLMSGCYLRLSLFYIFLSLYDCEFAIENVPSFLTGAFG